MMLLLMTVFIFGAVSAAVFAMQRSAAAEQNPVAIRLRELRALSQSSDGVLATRRPPLLLKLIAQLGGFLPAKDGTDAMRTGLIRAGYRRADSVLVFLGSKVALAILFPMVWTAVAYAMAKPIGDVFMISLVVGLVGFYLPTLFIAVRQAQRHTQILSALPDALDLMVVCVEAGLGLGAAIQRVGQEIRIASSALAEELSLVNHEMQTGVSRSDALRNLAERTGVEDIYALVAMLIQTDKLGTSIAMSLRSHADSMRTRRRQRAEQLARKAAIKLAFPLVFLIFPALMLVILGPAGVQLIKALSAGD
jgi:tight adherence protein C